MAPFVPGAVACFYWSEPSTNSAEETVDGRHYSLRGGPTADDRHSNGRDAFSANGIADLAG
ncbi:MAG: hypothetical protein QOC89_912 [Paraburkholderia sp.]|nr:hypothetical protein [Paraburkholderia sp.]